MTSTDYRVLELICCYRVPLLLEKSKYHDPSRCLTLIGWRPGTLWIINCYADIEYLVKIVSTYAVEV